MTGVVRIPFVVTFPAGSWGSGEGEGGAILPQKADLVVRVELGSLLFVSAFFRFFLSRRL